MRQDTDKLIEAVEEALEQLNTMAAKFDPKTAGEVGRPPLIAQSLGTLLAALVMETHGLRVAQDRANRIAVGQMEE